MVRLEKHKTMIFGHLGAILSIFAILLGSLMTPGLAHASDGDIDYASYAYYANKYDVNMRVNEDNSYDVTETIDMNFNDAWHGINRSIPLRNDLSRPDGSKSSNVAKLSNIKVDGAPFTTYRDGNNEVIKIGDPATTIVGAKNYKISYHYSLGRDDLRGNDELFYNIVGDKWYTVTKQFTFSITMPKSFDSSKLSFNSGITGSGDSSNVSFQANGNTITGHTIKPLRAGWAVTVRLVLPDNYFAYHPDLYHLFYDNLTVVSIVASLLALLIVFIIWWLFGRDRLITKVIQTGSIQDITVGDIKIGSINSLDVQTIKDGYASKKGVISLLVYLANKGYLKIEIKGRKKHNYVITQLKPYDGDDRNENYFMNNLFITPGSVTKNELEGHFYPTISSMINSVNQSEFNKSLFVENNKSRIAISVLAGLILLFGALLVPLATGRWSIVGLLFTLAVCLGGTVLSFRETRFASLWSSLRASTIVVLVLMIMFFFGFDNSNNLANLTGLKAAFNYHLPIVIAALISYAAFIGMGVFYHYMGKHSELGARLLGQVMGLEDFIKTVEKDRIEMMVQDDPNFFYSILPYAYALGVTDVWTKQFDGLALEPPDWCDGYGDDFSIDSFTSSALSGIADSISYSPPISIGSSSGGDSSGGDSSGGGFSGGGSGGGGGSAW